MDIKVDKTIENLDILRFGSNGEGIAINEGKILFIPFALPNENVDVFIEKENKKFNICKLNKINKKSEFRVNPICPYFTICGGCDLQHLLYEKSLEYKTQVLQDTINKIAKLFVNSNLVIASTQKYNYRNKCSFPVAKINGKTISGYYMKNSKNIIEVENCAIADNNINLAYSIVKNFVVEKNLGYDIYTKGGFIKHIVIRTLNDQIQIVLVTKNENVPSLMLLINALNEVFTDFSLFLNVNKIDNGEIFSNNFKLICGNPVISDIEFGIKYFISPYSFLQVNNDIKHKIYENILSLISKNDIVIDAYSGGGLLSAIMSKKAKYVYAVEINKSASENANQLAIENKIINLENINGDCGIVLPNLINKLSQSDNLTIVLDPARNGCDEKVLYAINEHMVDKLIYLSCNPATLSRDLIILAEKYDIVQIQPYDMFPQTSNLETLVVLKRKNLVNNDVF